VLAICPHGVSKEDVRDITEMRAGLVHSGAIVEKAKGREEELMRKLERIVRRVFITSYPTFLPWSFFG